MARLLVVALLAAFLTPSVPMHGTAALAVGLTSRSLLEVHDGDLVVTQDGAVVENLEIRGQLLIDANNVTVRNVWVYGFPWSLVDVKSGSFTIEDSELGRAGWTSQTCINGDNVVARRLDIHHCESLGKSP